MQTEIFENKITSYEIKNALLREGVDTATIKNFITYLNKNRQVLDCFCKYALDLARQGKKVGAMMIINKIRWDVEVESAGNFKVNNTAAPYLARVCELKYPQMKGFFEKREVKGVKEIL